MVDRPVAHPFWSDPIVTIKFLIFPKLSSHSRKLLWLVDAVYITRKVWIGGWRAYIKEQWYSQKEYAWMKLRGKI